MGSTGTGTTVSANLDLRGHNSTVDVGTPIIARSTNGTASNLSDSNGTVRFDTGTFTVGTLTMGLKSGASTGTATGSLNVGGGAFTVNTAFTLGSHSGAGAANATLNLTGGTFTPNVDILKGSSTATGTINLDGGTLDMTGKNIGSANAITMNAKSGTLKNVALINGSGGLTKTTAGALTLDGTNTYTGATTSSSGTLALAAGGSITSSSSVNLDAADTLDTSAKASYAVPGSQPVTFGIDPKGSGTSGKIVATGLNITNAVVTLSPTATLDDPVYVLAKYTAGSLTGSAFASVSGLPSGYNLDYAYEGNKIALVQSAGYSSWAAVNAIGSTPSQDKDGDGVTNAVEYVLGGDVNTNDLSKLPTVDSSGANLVFTFQRKTSSIDGSTVLGIEVDTDISGWETSYNVPDTAVANNPGVTVLKDTPTGFDTITLVVPKGSDPKKFARIKVTVVE